MIVFQVSDNERTYDDLYRTLRDAKRAIGNLPGYTIHHRNWKLVYVVKPPIGGDAIIFRSYAAAIKAVGHKQFIYLRRLM